MLLYSFIHFAAVIFGPFNVLFSYTLYPTTPAMITIIRINEDRIYTGLTFLSGPGAILWIPLRIGCKTFFIPESFSVEAIFSSAAGAASVSWTAVSSFSTESVFFTVFHHPVLCTLRITERKPIPSEFPVLRKCRSSHR